MCMIETNKQSVCNCDNMRWLSTPWLKVYTCVQGPAFECESFVWEPSLGIYVAKLCTCSWKSLVWTREVHLTQNLLQYSEVCISCRVFSLYLGCDLPPPVTWPNTCTLAWPYMVSEVTLNQIPISKPQPIIRKFILCVWIYDLCLTFV